MYIKLVAEFQPNLFVNFDAYINKTEFLGKIDAIFDIPSNILFSITHISDIEILIPAHTDFIANVDKKAKKIFFNLPEGYLDVYLTKKHQKDDGD